MDYMVGWKGRAKTEPPSARVSRVLSTVFGFGLPDSFACTRSPMNNAASKKAPERGLFNLGLTASSCLAAAAEEAETDQSAADEGEGGGFRSLSSCVGEINSYTLAHLSARNS